MTLGDGFHAVPPGYLAMVVTYLEMTLPAPLRGVALPDGVTLEPLPRNVEIYRDLFRRVGEDWLWYGRLLLSDADLQAILEDPNLELWCLIRDGVREGLLELEFHDDGACKLAYFGLTRNLIGSGSGAYLMDRAIEKAWSKDIKRFYLNTCTLDSPQAMDFYKRSGFTPYKREVEIAEDPRRLGFYPESAVPNVPNI